MKKKIILIGGGGHCKCCIDVIEQEGSYEIAGIIDKKELLGNKVLDYKVIGCDDNLDAFLHIGNIIVTVGHIKSPDTRIRLYSHVKKLGFKPATIVSPLAYVSKYAQIGEGTIVMHHALVNAEATIGDNCIINSKALIEHNAVVESHCHISTAAVVNGGLSVRRGTFWGSGAVGKEYTETKEYDFIKANSIFKGHNA